MRQELMKAGSKVGKFAVKHLPVIFAVTGVVCISAGAYMAAKASKTESPNLSRKDLVKHYKKPLIMAAAGSAFIGAGCYISAKRYKASVTREFLARQALRHTHDAIYEVGGDKMASKIDSMIAEKYDQYPYGVEMPGKEGAGNVLFKDGVLGGYWRTSIYDVKDAIVNANDILGTEDELSANGLLELFGRSKDSIDIGDKMGYSRKFDDKFKIEILPSPNPSSWETDICELTGEPCYVFRYTEPWEHYDRNF